jgi:hypothetical protein
MVKSKMLSTILLAGCLVLPAQRAFAAQTTPAETVMSWLGANPKVCDGKLIGTDPKMKALRKAYSDLAKAEVQMDRQDAEASICETAAKILTSNGYSVGEQDYDEKNNSFFFEIKKMPPGTLADKLFQQLKTRGVRLRIGGMSNYGVMHYDASTLWLSPYHAFLGHDILSATAVHESIHFVIDDNISHGIASPFDGQIQGRNPDDGLAVTSVPLYTQFFNFQELATHSNDVRMIASGFPSMEVIAGEKTEDVLAEKRKNLALMAREIVTVTAKIKDMLKDDAEFAKQGFAEDPYHKGVIAVGIPYTSSTGNPAVLQILLPELKSKRLKEWSRETLRAALNAKLSLMNDYASKFKVP